MLQARGLSPTIWSPFYVLSHSAIKIALSFISSHCIYKYPLLQKVLFPYLYFKFAYLSNIINELLPCDIYNSTLYVLNYFYPLGSSFDIFLVGFVRPSFIILKEISHHSLLAFWNHLHSKWFILQ